MALRFDPATWAVQRCWILRWRWTLNAIRRHAYYPWYYRSNNKQMKVAHNRTTTRSKAECIYCILVRCIW